MYGHIATATGWTFMQIDKLTLWDVNDLFTYWEDHPPIHVLVGAYLSAGKTARAAKSRKSTSRASFDHLAQAVTMAGGALNKVLPTLYKV